MIKESQILKADDILICAGSGSKEHIGKVAYIDNDTSYAFGGFMAVIRTRQNLMSRFLFHFLLSTLFKKYLESALNSATINNLNASVMEGLKIPLPPLPIQQEIVRILDTFTAMNANLEEELEARKKQYIAIREQVLSNNSQHARLLSLRDLSIKYSSGSTPLKSKQEYYLDGTIPWLRTQEVVFNEIWETDCFITEKAVAETSA